MELAAAALVAAVSGHGAMIHPKPRNAIDGDLPFFNHGACAFGPGSEVGCSSQLLHVHAYLSVSVTLCVFECVHICVVASVCMLHEARSLLTRVSEHMERSCTFTD